MDSKRAKECILIGSEWNGSGQCTYNELKEAIRIAADALEKQIPKKPEKTKDVRYGNGYEYNDWICPTCHGFLCFEPSPNVTIHHCKCGQALKWSDFDD